MANKFCTNCGSKLEGRFCRQCGADMGAPIRQNLVVPPGIPHMPPNIGGQSIAVTAKRSRCTYAALALFSLSCIFFFITTLAMLSEVEHTVSRYGVSYSKLWFVLLMIGIVAFDAYSVYSIIIKKCGAKKMMSIILIFIIAAVIEFIILLIVENNVSDSLFRTASNALVNGQFKFGTFSSVSIYMALRAYLTAIIRNVFVLLGIIASFVLSIVGMSREQNSGNTWKQM